MGSEEQINSVLEVKKALRQKSDDSFLPFVDEESWIISYFWLFDADKQSFKMKIVDEESMFLGISVSFFRKSETEKEISKKYNTKCFWN